MVSSFLQLAKSPMRSLLLWLKPRGLDALMHFAMPKEIREYFEFTEKMARTRVEEERKLSMEHSVARKDMFHFLCTARNPDTGEFALTTEDLIADANLLTVAGSDTTSTTVAGLFFYITRHPRVYAKLVKEIRENFQSAEEIGSGFDFMAKCEYLRAVMHETMRLCPPGPSEVERTVLKGGTMVAGERIAQGMTVGVPMWALAQNENVWGDAGTFRPERWIVSHHPDTFNTQEEVNRLKRSYFPFAKGVGACLGQKMAMIQVCIIVARTLWRYDVKNAQGQRVGEGRPELGWGRSNRNHFQFRDAYIGLREGPIVQFRPRQVEQP
jgi:cytochrome P450